VLGGNLVSTNYVAQELKLLLQQCTLRELELFTSSLKSVRHLSELTDMNVEAGSDDNDIIKVYEQGLLV